jgi:subtilase family serine protease
LSKKKNMPYYAIATVLITAMILATAYALYEIWSNEVSVTVNPPPTLELDDPSDGTTLDTYTFTGSLKLGGVGVSGKTVTLYVNGVSTGLNGVTGADGSFSINWSTTTAGTYKFKVKADV